MAWALKGGYAETCSCELMCPCTMSLGSGPTMAEATRSRIIAFGIEHEGRTGLSASAFARAS